MAPDKPDPVEAADDGRDLYGITTWKNRSVLDTVAVSIYWLAIRTSQVILVLLTLLIFIGIGGGGFLLDPPIGFLTALSIVPALALAGYVCTVVLRPMSCFHFSPLLSCSVFSWRGMLPSSIACSNHIFRPSASSAWSCFTSLLWGRRRNREVARSTSLSVWR